MNSQIVQPISRSLARKGLLGRGSSAVGLLKRPYPGVMSSSDANLRDFLRTHFHSMTSTTLSGSDTAKDSAQLYPQISYTDNERAEIHQWTTTALRLAVPGQDEAKHHERLGALNVHLSTRTTLLGSKPSIADLALYHNIAPTVRAWSPQERTGEKGYHHIVRHLDFVQNARLFGLSIPSEEKIKIDIGDVRFVPRPRDPKAEKERMKKEKAAPATALEGSTGKEKELVVGKGRDQQSESLSTNTAPPTAKKDKKEKAPKQPKQPTLKAEATPLSPHLIDLRVGHILRAIPHPNADSLYVSTIACGDAEGADNTNKDEQTGKIVRTVCSGLNGLIPLAEMQNRKIVAVCNLKPVTMRGVKSAAMVLAASPRLARGEEANHKGPVELVEIPEGAEAGDRICFAGWEGEPEGVLNPKKKVWETLQPGFITDGEGQVRFDARAVEPLKDSEKEKDGSCLLTSKGGRVCSVKSLKGAIVR